jgi:hypothetical protein
MGNEMEKTQEYSSLPLSAAKTSLVKTTEAADKDVGWRLRATRPLLPELAIILRAALKQRLRQLPAHVASRVLWRAALHG